MSVHIYAITDGFVLTIMRAVFIEFVFFAWWYNNKLSIIFREICNFDLISEKDFFNIILCILGS